MSVCALYEQILPTFHGMKRGYYFQVEGNGGGGSIRFNLASKSQRIREMS